MKTKFSDWEFSSFIFTVGAGTFLHFLFDISGKNFAAGLISAVNESTWEHLKLIFVPYFLFSIVEYYAVGRQYKDFFMVKAKAVMLGMLSVTALFYTYSGIAGTNFAIANILIFIIGAGIASVYSYRKMNKSKGGSFAGLVILTSIMIMFALFTFYPLHIGLFLDPVSLSYGIV